MDEKKLDLYDQIQMICVTFTSLFTELAFVVGNFLMSIDFNVVEMFGSWIHV